MPTLSPEAWVQIRTDYEHTERPIEDICAEHGISSGTLRDRMRRWGWTRRRPPIAREGPPAVVMPPSTATHDLWPPGPRVRGDERTIDWPPISPPLSPPSETAGRDSEPAAARPVEDPQHEPSPHLPSIDAPPADDAIPIGRRLQGAVAGVMPAIETTLATLAAGPARPREMELAARALGSLTRTLRELNGLLAQHGADEPPRRDIEELRRSVMRKLENVVAAERDDRPRRYLAGWEDFAAGAAVEAECPAPAGVPRARRSMQ